MEFSIERIGSVGVGVLEAAINMYCWCGSDGAPASAFVCISAEMCFVYANDFVFVCQRQDLPLEVFLKVLTAFSSRFLCSGRGTFHDIFSS